MYILVKNKYIYDELLKLYMQDVEGNAKMSMPNFPREIRSS